MFPLFKKSQPKPLDAEAEYLAQQRQRAIEALGTDYVLHPHYNPAAHPEHHLRCVRPKSVDVVMGRRV